MKVLYTGYLTSILKGAKKAMRRGYRQAPNPKTLVDRAVLRGIVEREVAGRMRERVAMAGRVRGGGAGPGVAGCLSTSSATGACETSTIVTQRGETACGLGRAKPNRARTEGGAPGWYVKGRRRRQARAGGAPAQSGVKSPTSPVVRFAAGFARRTGGTMVFADCRGGRSRGLPDFGSGRERGNWGWILADAVRMAFGRESLDL